MRWKFSLDLCVVCLVFVKAKSISDNYEEQRKSNEMDYENLTENYAEDEMYDETPANFDWRDQGAVTKVKNQGECENSDWAFAATGALESQLYIKDKQLLDLSAQELIDCSTKAGNFGCEGGTVKNAFHYIEENGISTEQSYPFTGQENTCPNKGKNTIANNANIKCEMIPSNFEMRMKQMLAIHGPILAIIDGSLDSFRNYKEGIYQDENCGKTGKHNVLIVGYGETNDTNEKYWIVKNSWGEDWGEKGYIKIAREKGNVCGIASNVTFIIYNKKMIFLNNYNIIKDTASYARSSIKDYY